MIEPTEHPAAAPGDEATDKERGLPPPETAREPQPQSVQEQQPAPEVKSARELQRQPVRERRAALLLTAGERAFCVFKDEAQEAVEWREPAPLPRAPQAVLGLVSVRGRMFTLLDSRALLLAGERVAHEATHEEALDSRSAPSSYNFILPLRGDEQLALACVGEPRVLEIFMDQLEQTPSDEPGTKLLRGIVRNREHEGLALLDPAEIFEAAMQGAERRRRRF